MRRFEFRDAESHELWEFEVKGPVYTVRRRVGAHEQVWTKTLANGTLAIAEANKKIAEKVERGYVELVLEPKSKTARHPSLEAEICANPEDHQSWHVYADWLQSEGDPWGARLGLALRHTQAEGALKSQLADQLEMYDFDNRKQLYGARLIELLDREGFKYIAPITWKYGLVMKVGEPGPDWEDLDSELMLEALANSPAARLLKMGPEAAARGELRERVFELLSDRLEVFPHRDPGFYWFMSHEPLDRAEECNLWEQWQARGEQICEHDYGSAIRDGFSLYGDCTLTVRRYPECRDQAAFVAECVYHSFTWYSDEPHCGWRLDVREVPAGGWTEIIRGYAYCSSDATAEQIFPMGTPGPIERVIAIIDDGNTRVFAIRTPSTWLIFEFETS